MAEACAVLAGHEALSVIENVHFDLDRARRRGLVLDVSAEVQDQATGM